MTISQRTRRNNTHIAPALVARRVAGITLLLAGTLGLLVFSGSARADDWTGARNHAGTVVLRVHALGVFPENRSSSISAIGGNVDIPNRLAPEIDVSYFIQ